MRVVWPQLVYLQPVHVWFIYCLFGLWTFGSVLPIYVVMTNTLLTPLIEGFSKPMRNSKLSLSELCRSGLSLWWHLVRFVLIMTLRRWWQTEIRTRVSESLLAIDYSISWLWFWVASALAHALYSHLSLVFVRVCVLWCQVLHRSLKWWTEFH